MVPFDRYMRALDDADSAVDVLCVWDASTKSDRSLYCSIKLESNGSFGFYGFENMIIDVTRRIFVTL